MTPSPGHVDKTASESATQRPPPGQPGATGACSLCKWAAACLYPLSWASVVMVPVVLLVRWSAARRRSSRSSLRQALCLSLWMRLLPRCDAPEGKVRVIALPIQIRAWSRLVCERSSQMPAPSGCEAASAAGEVVALITIEVIHKRRGNLNEVCSSRKPYRLVLCGIVLRFVLQDVVETLIGDEILDEVPKVYSDSMPWL